MQTQKFKCIVLMANANKNKNKKNSYDLHVLPIVNLYFEEVAYDQTEIWVDCLLSVWLVSILTN